MVKPPKKEDLTAASSAIGSDLAAAARHGEEHKGCNKYSSEYSYDGNAVIVPFEGSILLVDASIRIGGARRNKDGDEARLD